MSDVIHMDEHRVKADRPTAFLTRAELAHEMRVSTKTIDRWVKAGCPSETWGMRVRRFRLADVNRWLQRRAA